jgi:hypothetical protein
MTYGIAAEIHLLKLQRLQIRVFPIFQFPKTHTGPGYAYGFPVSVSLRLRKKLCRKQAEVMQNHENENVRHI